MYIFLGILHRNNIEKIIYSTLAKITKGINKIYNIKKVNIIMRISIIIKG